ncbi:Spy/CpxP family protein refolding chaperone [Ferrimonas balearica]|uniref:Spy/CpxP family protein refolding chaperone n=1 Tax=Ferrimonas balearica TaxID=44012 RepID=UPI001C998567|nr:Spy/CpxP family protein refolding chaperone [Ferrimonas balearica]MBY5923289.1 Spy/CpxP family protein refolding chaperone [Ferrimonas balearica]MBY5995247.1 Spy/CpxP family protein refolding chaperone [Ferrimonas balearica]
MKTSVKLLVIGALASTSLVAVAKGGDGEYRCEMRGHGGHHGKAYHHEKRGHHGGEVRKMLRGLDLTAEQKEKVKALIEAAHTDKPQRDMAKMEAHMAARQALMSSPDFDEAAAREMIGERQAKMADRELARMKLQHDIMQVLTDEQKAKLAERHTERLERFRAHHGE